MKAPLQITFRDVPRTDEVDKKIQLKAAKLDRICDQITQCRVVVESPHRHHNRGNVFHVRVDLSVPGQEIVVNREPEQDHSHEDLSVALRDAFEAAQRQLKAYQRRRIDSRVAAAPV